MYSYHIFYFPFKWEIPKLKDKLFHEQTDLSKIPVNSQSNWERHSLQNESDLDLLYNEKNYYHKFVHSALYDENKENTVLHHYERKEPKSIENNVKYTICLKDKTYTLRVDAINLNLYATGVGILSFYLINEIESQSKPEDIRLINQYGRRIMPPFIKDLDYRSEIAYSLEISGLNTSDKERYYEDFKKYTNENYWTAATFICNLIKDYSKKIEISPVIDDRMFVNCWYGNDGLAKDYILAIYKKDKKVENVLSLEKEQLDQFLMGDFWYQYVFIDNGLTCQNAEMQHKLIHNHTYKRWQKAGTLYGVSRYSLVCLTNESSFAKEVISTHVRTIYGRMVELCLVQRASLLRFSDEVTQVGEVDKKDAKQLSAKVCSLYKEYLHFVNQIYFREVSSQEQAIELYEMLLTHMKTERSVNDLDKEIQELHQYITIIEDNERNKRANYLNLIATIFLPAGIITGIFGMNPLCDNDSTSWLVQLSSILILTSITLFLTKNKRLKL